MGLCKFQRQPIQVLQAYNQQDNKQSKNEKQVSKGDRNLNFDNYIKCLKKNYEYWKAQISYDENFLALYGRKQKKIKIFSLKIKKIIKIIKIIRLGEIYIETIKFSNNSRYLLFGDNKGYIYCYHANNNFKIIYFQNVHNDIVNEIYTIDDDQIITCSYDKSLIITNIKYNQQLLKIQKVWIEGGIAFDKSNNFIICGSEKKIKFFNRKDGKCQIKQKNAHVCEIFMIQLISEDNNLICADIKNLFLWQIDYQMLKLNKLKQFKNIYICSFTSVFNNNKIVVFGEVGIIILDKDLVVLQTIKHNINIKSIYCIYDIQVFFRTRQLNSLNYIIIPGYQNLLILKKVRKLLK